MKKFALGFILLLVICSILVFLLEINIVEASGTIYIRADGSIDPDTASILSVDNITYTFTGNIYDEIVVERDDIVVDGAGYTVQGDGSGTGMNLTRRSNVTIMNMKIKDFRHGIFHDYFEIPIPSSENIANKNDDVYFSYSNNTISGNTITNNLYGVHLSCAFGNTISSNTIINNGDGIALERFSNYNTMVGNTITNNYNGILVKPSDYNTISGNNITNNWYGIHVSGTSDSHSIFGNNITANGYCGIFLHDFSSHNTIVENNIINNYNGIYLGESKNNHIYHNNFISNTQQVYSRNATNVWDNGYPSGGNYWSAYNGTDMVSGPYQNGTGSDGIGDTPYVIDANNQDNYPLMGMFHDFPVALEEQTYHIATICNSTISEFQFTNNLTTIINGVPGTWLVNVIVFNVSGEYGKLGFCRICIPMALMNEPYEVFVGGTWVPYTLLPCSNSTHNYLYFTYNHSTQQVEIIPEFPTWTSMLLLLVVLTVAIVTYKRRLSGT